MKKYVKIKFHGKTSDWLLWVDSTTKWSLDEIECENAKAVSIAKMAFLDHGEPLVPDDVLPLIVGQEAAYTKPILDGTVVLVDRGGCFTILAPTMEITDETYSGFYPIPKGAAIICENDPFDKHNGLFEREFKQMAASVGVDSVYWMWSFRNQSEAEIINAFKDAPAILFRSQHTEADWWELMLRCIIKSQSKAKIIGKKLQGDSEHQRLQRERLGLCVGMAKKFGITVEIV